ncbi:MAG TPA: sensor histidine kinase N-terminal domain-containing protein [Thiobacillaceae bacterium]|nr:sensor histidine kinase N-terminal domain-containing protein [Thiobacillaceae bacterium]HNU64188.1 sensor histidine kinase N-terminal domain-containing protein [Thiobacillaceae bacterium]
MSARPEPTRWYSLRRRLLVWLLGGLSLGWLAALVFTYFDAHHEIDELFDDQLVQVARVMLALAEEYDDDEDLVWRTDRGHKVEKRFVFQIWDESGRLLARSPGAPRHALAARDGFSDTHALGSGRWRCYSLWDREGRLRVQVAENHHVREEISGHIASRLLLPASFGLPLLGVWIWFSARHSLAPLDDIAREIAARAPETLEPVTPDVAPREIRPLVLAMNSLFGRVSRTLEQERRFTADAAHELRTPLAAIVAQAQVAGRARDAAERAHALGQIATSGRRAGRLVEQLLTLARLDPAAGLPMTPLRLDRLAADECAEHGAAALARDISLELEVEEEAMVSGQADMLRILLRNLLDNALRHTSRGGRVVVRVSGRGLSVADDGPGIPAQARAQVLRRFHRLAGQEVEGSGLGLSIVARVAALHRARLELEDNRPGLVVRLEFPAA